MTFGANGYSVTVARNQTTIDAPPERVFAALADGEKYDRWVVGAKNIRAVDDQFPAVGAKLHHTVGAGPVEVNDSTKVEAVDPGHRLVLEARVRPVGIARIEFLLAPDPQGGTRVTMDEVVTDPPLARLLSPLLDPLIKGRNVATLEKLKQMVEEAEPGTT